MLLCVSLTEAKLFDIDNSINPGSGCSVFGCSFMGDIYMNGYTIYNATFVNASIKEFDPIFTAENSSIWGGINSKYNASNPAGYITLANISDNWVNTTGDTMTGNLNMSDHNITDVNYLFVHNISGRSPINILSEVISNSAITATTFYGNIQGNNGTIYGVTITNGSINNLRVSDSALFNTSLIPEINYTWSLGEPARIWKDFYVGNLYATNISSPILNQYYLASNPAGYVNSSGLQAYNDTALIQAVNLTIKQPSGQYLAYNTTNFWVNESALNTTINNISKVRKMTYTMNCTGPNCNVISAINISYQITEVKVVPTSNSPYKFSLTEYPNTALIIDKNLQAHVGTWDISKNYVIDGQVQANIINGNAEQYNITIVYLQNGVQ
jgi:hypothetical protein